MNSRRLYLALLSAAAVSLTGCGGATAPCPTPTAELDQLRTQTEELGKEVDQATAAERHAADARDGAARRVQSAQAALDSLHATGRGTH